jgi:signal peptidase I
VKRFDPVVFNYPYGDTIIVDPYYAGHNYYEILRGEAIYEAASEMARSGIQPDDFSSLDKYLSNRAYYESKARANFESGICKNCGASKGLSKPVSIGGIRHRPMDKKENYIKSCVGLPGENLSIRDRQVFINDQPIENPEGLAWNYRILPKSPAALERIMGKYNIVMSELGKRDSVLLIPLSVSQYEELKNSQDIVSIEVSNEPLVEINSLSMYPNSPMDPFCTWTQDNYGPIHIPARGETIELTPANIELYKRVIDVYEENDLEVRDGKVFINGTEQSSYTFKDNYYWMMGDNRHHSADSRYWGFVPETHLVGRASFIWFSKERQDYHGSGKIRWDRVFRFVN